MKNILLIRKQHSGVTLIEMTVVIVVLVLLVSISFFGFNGFRNWQLGSVAGQALRQVETAQRTFLSDFPTRDVTSLTQSEIEPYLSNGFTFDRIINGTNGVGGIEGISGEVLDFNVAVFPPQLVTGGAVYDPSPSPQDGLWDLGR